MRLIAALLMFSFATATWAHWTKVVETDTTVEYIDLQTIEKRGDHRRVWTVRDLKRIGGQGELSFRRLLEFDCQKGQYLIVWLAGHSGHMAGGRVLGSGNNPIPTWYSISKGSSVEASLKMVCGHD
jgi:Surface-adhesin protein E